MPETLLLIHGAALLAPCLLLLVLIGTGIERFVEKRALEQQFRGRPAPEPIALRRPVRMTAPLRARSRLRAVPVTPRDRSAA